jgi:regulator of replication initiation timing
MNGGKSWAEILAEIEALRAENERLRKALEHYAAIEGPPYQGTPYLARAALKATEAP